MKLVIAATAAVLLASIGMASAQSGMRADQAIRHNRAQSEGRNAYDMGTDLLGTASGFGGMDRVVPRDGRGGLELIAPNGTDLGEVGGQAEQGD